MAMAITSTNYRSSLHPIVEAGSRVRPSERLANMIAALDSVDDKTLDDAFDIADGEKDPESNVKAAESLQELFEHTSSITDHTQHVARRVNAALAAPARRDFEAAAGWEQHDRSNPNEYDYGFDSWTHADSDAGIFEQNGQFFSTVRGSQRGPFGSFGEAARDAEKRGLKALETPIDLGWQDGQFG